LEVKTGSKEIPRVSTIRKMAGKRMESQPVVAPRGRLVLTMMGWRELAAGFERDLRRLCAMTVGDKLSG
jgi:hypothetical protein